MSRDKQINKMAKELCRASTCHIKDEPTECYHGCKAWVYAERAVDLGYRKESDVVREIFEEIDNRISFSHTIIDVLDILAEIKKEHESKGVTDEKQHP